MAGARAKRRPQGWGPGGGAGGGSSSAMGGRGSAAGSVSSELSVPDDEPEAEAEPWLQRRFRSLQRRLHPDLFARRSQAERDFSAQHSALVNEAYGTLRSPLRRGIYLLELSGEALGRGADGQAEPEFLARILELDERLSASGTGPADADLEAHIAAKQEELAKELGQAFDRDDLQKAKKVLVKMKYFANLEEKVKKRKIPS